jgi:hypothetical protein
VRKARLVDEEWAKLVHQALFDMRANVDRIRELLEGDEEAEEEDA